MRDGKRKGRLLLTSSLEELAVEGREEPATLLCFDPARLSLANEKECLLPLLKLPVLPLLRDETSSWVLAECGR